MQCTCTCCADLRVVGIPALRGWLGCLAHGLSRRLVLPLALALALAAVCAGVIVARMTRVGVLMIWIPACV